MYVAILRGKDKNEKCDDDDDDEYVFVYN